ncbi:MAG: hypothetical protein LBR06_09525 [Bacteroidales bacterium]|jgi:hypothetical protein|nr:hypothetical protein [Bacteroidales bacterium]
MKIYSHTFGIVACIAALSSCIHTETVPIQDAERTVIVYIAGENSLSGNAIQNINQMEQGYKSTMGNLIVYADINNGRNPAILKIKHDESSEIKSDTVVRFSTPLNSADPTVMHSVLTTIIEKYPAKTFGLILWSHGTGWLPSVGYSSRTEAEINTENDIPPTAGYGWLSPAGYTLNTKWFGQDGNNKMDIWQFEEAIPDNTFDYIMFDACLMGSTEVAWELRKKTDYLLAAPTEVIDAGFPYTTIVPLLFANTDVPTTLNAVAQDFYDYYNKQTGAYRSASIAVYYLPALENLAAVTKIVILNNLPTSMNYHFDELQRLDYSLIDGGKIPVLYDFINFLENNFPNDDVLEIYDKLRKVVVYERHTEIFINFNLVSVCGLGTYVPRDYSSSAYEGYFNYLNSYYRNREFAQAFGFNFLILD